jgi:hypothetical protein
LFTESWVYFFLGVMITWFLCVVILVFMTLFGCLPNIFCKVCISHLVLGMTLVLISLLNIIQIVIERHKIYLSWNFFVLNLNIHLKH